MKYLIYKDSSYYLTDDLNDKKGKTRKLKYQASPSNMPHQHFRDYIVVYGRSTCPYCIKTIELLKNIKKTIFIEIDKPPIELFGKNNLFEILKKDIKNHSTVPVVFDKGIFIGGSSDAEKYFKSK